MMTRGTVGHSPPRIDVREKRSRPHQKLLSNPKIFQPNELNKIITGCNCILVWHNSTSITVALAVAASFLYNQTVTFDMTDIDITLNPGKDIINSWR